MSSILLQVLKMVIKIINTVLGTMSMKGFFFFFGGFLFLKCTLISSNSSKMCSSEIV